MKQKQQQKDCRENGRIILAHGEVTGHCHEVVVAETQLPPDMDAAQFFEVDGVRTLIVLQPCVLRHQEHGRIAYDPTGTVRRFFADTDEARRILGADRYEAIVAGRVDRVSLFAVGDEIALQQTYPASPRQGDVCTLATSPGTWRVVRQREWAGPDVWRQVPD